MSGNKNNIFAKCICMILTAVLLLSGCAQQKKYHKQTKYHEEIQELEEYVLAQMGDYININEPTIKDEGKNIHFGIVFTVEYTYDEDLVVSYPPLAVMEDTRTAINTFLRENPEYFPEEFRLDISFSIAPDGSPMSGPHYGEMANWSNICNEQSCNELCRVNYHVLLNEDNLEYLHSEGVRSVVLYEYWGDKADTVNEIIRSFPDVDEVFVNSELEDEMLEQWPELHIIGVNY